MGGEVMNMRMRVLLIGLLAVTVTAGCGRAPQVGQVGDYRLYEAASTSNSQLVQVIDSHAHSAQRQLPLGTPSPDWSRFFTVKGNQLEIIDPRTGIVTGSLRLPGAYHLPAATIGGLPGGISPDGSWLVLQKFDGTGSTVMASHMLVIDTTLAKPPVPIDLKGDFSFDAVSNDGTSVYLIEHVNVSNYYVRLYHVQTSQLDPQIVFDKSDGIAAMSGLRLSGIPSADGTMLFSVYARAHKGAFIHALMLNAPIAFCVDLPGTGYMDGSNSSLEWSLAMGANGSTLYATNGAMGIVAVIDSGGGGVPHVVRTAHFASPAPAAGQGSAVLSHDGRTLVAAGANGLLWLDTSSLTVMRSALVDWRIRSIALSPDGGTLYAVSDAGGIAELSMSGAVKATFDPNVGQPMALMRVEAT
jgi:hypothetical protein